MKLLSSIAIALVLCCGEARADEPAGDCRELLKPATPVPEAENGAALMALMVEQCDAGEIRSYDFGFRPPEYAVNRESLEAFFKEQPKLVEITRRILARKRFQNGSAKAPDGIALLTKACDAIRLQALVLAQEGRVEKAVPDLLLVTAFSRKLVQSPESTTLLMMGIGMAGKDATCLAQALRQARNTAGMRPLAIGYEPLTHADMDCAGAIRGELRNYCDHFDIIRAGGEPLQKLLAELHLVSEMDAAFKKAFQKTKQDDSDPRKGIADTVASREERIAALVKNPSASMKAQLRETAKIDWKKHDQDFTRYVRAVLATDSSTWERFQATLPHPRSFFAGFVLEQMVPLHEVRQFFSSRLYKAAATTRMVKLSLAINEWQSDHEGALPERLEQLVPRYIAAIPADPFDGKPVRYHRDWQWLWCVGPDLKDATGRLKRKEDRAVKDDDEVMTAGRRVE